MEGVQRGCFFFIYLFDGRLFRLVGFVFFGAGG